MGAGAIEKPTVFISHAASDGEFAHAVKQEIEKVFAQGAHVFCTSSPGTIRAGDDWLATIERKLESTHAVIVIVTPVSIERPWLWFEIGATWARERSGHCKIYPLCAPEIALSELPDPLGRLQALSMGKAADLRLLFLGLIEQFHFGSIQAFRASNITKRIPKYKDVRIAEVDLNEKHLYSGPYRGYSDEELVEVIDANLFAPVVDNPIESLRRQDLGTEAAIANGKLLHYREIDRHLGLPPGTAKRLIHTAAKRYGLSPLLENENIVRYRSSK